MLSMDASDTGMGAVLEQEQEEDGRVVKKISLCVLNLES